MKKIFMRLAMVFTCLAVFMAGLAQMPRSSAAQQSKAGTALTAEFGAPVVDQARLLHKEQAEKLTAKIKEIEARHQVRIGICTLQDLPHGTTAGKFANNMLDKYYANGANGSIVFVIAMGSRDWYISTDNAMRQRIVDGVGIEGLKEMFLDDLSDGNYAESFNNFADGVDKYLAYYEENGEPYDPSKEFSLLAAVVAVLAAIVAGWGFRAYLISCMSNVAPAVEASAYLKQGSFNLAQSHDTFLYTTVVRETKSKDSSSSSSDSSHGGGGGKF